MGLWGGKSSYLGDSWNRLDGMVVVLSLLPYAQLLVRKPLLLPCYAVPETRPSGSELR
jgi:hypothetical protein